MKKTADGRGLARVSRTTVAIINGDEDLSSWSEEELARGQKRGSDGRFRKPPVLVAKAVHDELVRRKHAAAYALLRESTHDAVKVLVEIFNDPEAEDPIRVRAAELILDRVLGKAPQHVSLNVDAVPLYQRMIADAIVPTVEDALRLMQAEADEEIVEGELVEEPVS